MTKAKEKKLEGTKVNLQINKENKNTANMLLDGELTIYDVNLIRDKLVETMEKHKNITINLEKISRIDSAGFQLLLACLKEQENEKTENSIKLGSVSQDVQKVFEQYGETFG